MFVFDGLPKPSEALFTDDNKHGGAMEVRPSTEIETTKQNMIHRGLNLPTALQQARQHDAKIPGKWLQSYFDLAMTIIKFWLDFFIYNWQHQRFMLVVFLVAALSLLLTRPVAFQALILCICVSCIIV